MSYAPYPQWGRFFYQSAFCNTASHIWQVSCQNENRRYFLDLKHPNLCLTLENYDDYFGNGSSCSNWPSIYFQTNTGYFDWEWFECNNWLFIWLPYFVHFYICLCIFVFSTRCTKQGNQKDNQFQYFSIVLKKMSVTLIQNNLYFQGQIKPFLKKCMNMEKKILH